MLSAVTTHGEGILYKNEHGYYFKSPKVPLGAFLTANHDNIPKNQLLISIL